MSKMQIYSLPTYDHNTDTFKDGALPKNVDGYFAKGKEHTNYYTDAPAIESHSHWSLSGSTIYSLKEHSFNQ